MWQMLVNHLLQFIFLRDFYDENRKVSFKHKWVWVVHGLNYPYMLFVYLNSDAAVKDPSEARKMWVPLDFILTVCISLY